MPEHIEQRAGSSWAVRVEQRARSRTDQRELASLRHLHQFFWINSLPSVQPRLVGRDLPIILSTRKPTQYLDRVAIVLLDARLRRGRTQQVREHVGHATKLCTQPRAHVAIPARLANNFLRRLVTTARALDHRVYIIDHSVGEIGAMLFDRQFPWRFVERIGRLAEPHVLQTGFVFDKSGCFDLFPPFGWRVLRFDTGRFALRRIG